MNLCPECGGQIDLPRLEIHRRGDPPRCGCGEESLAIYTLSTEMVVFSQIIDLKPQSDADFLRDLAMFIEAGDGEFTLISLDISEDLHGEWRIMRAMLEGQPTS